MQLEKIEGIRYYSPEEVIELGKKVGLDLEYLYDGTYEQKIKEKLKHKPLKHYRRLEKIKWNGVERTLQEWAEVTGISYSCLWRRLYGDDMRHWSVEKALTTPMRKKSKHRFTNRSRS